MLVVVEDRNVHPRAELALDLEAFGGLDVLQVDGAEGGLQGGDDLDQRSGSRLLDLDVEDVDAGEFLEEDRLALHHRLRGERADIAEAQHGGAVGDDRDHVAAAWYSPRRHRGWRRSPRRRRRRRANRPGRGRAGWPCAWSARRQLPGPRQAVIVQRGLAEILVHESPLVPGHEDAAGGAAHATVGTGKDRGGDRLAGLARPAGRVHLSARPNRPPGLSRGYGAVEKNSNFHGVSPTSTSSWRVYHSATTANRARRGV